jgi:hypothetical protein
MQRGSFAAAGDLTTRNTINGAIILLSEHPDQMKLLAAQPALVKTATEEFLRYLSPVRGFGRTVLQDVEVRGRKLSTGQRVFNFFMSGNRDGEIFQAPEVFDLTRPRDKPNLGFGFGEHFCIWGCRGPPGDQRSVRGTHAPVLGSEARWVPGPRQTTVGQFLGGCTGRPLLALRCSRRQLPKGSRRRP